MKQLLVLRHAKAESQSESGRDFDRPLAARGWEDSRAVGRAMQARGLHPDSVIASPAKRVIETLEAIAEGYGPLDAEFDERIFDNTPEALLATVHDAEVSVERLLIAGHNPGLQELILLLASDDSGGLRREVAAGFSTATLAVVDLPLDEWRDVREGCGGRITSLVRPDSA